MTREFCGELQRCKNNFKNYGKTTCCLTQCSCLKRFTVSLTAINLVTVRSSTNEPAKKNTTQLQDMAVTLFYWHTYFAWFFCVYPTTYLPTYLPACLACLYIYIFTYLPGTYLVPVSLPTHLSIHLCTFRLCPKMFLIYGTQIYFVQVVSHLLHLWVK